MEKNNENQFQIVLLQSGLSWRGSRLFFFNPDYHDEAPEKGVDALEIVKQSEQSLKNLLDLKEEADIDDENILLEIDAHLHSNKKTQGGCYFIHVE